MTFACGPYDRTQVLRDGTLQPEGIELTYLPLQPAEIFWRMLQYKEFDASEMSLSNYTTLINAGNCPFIAIPVFPSRVVRHGYFFINTEKGIKSPADLKGKRGGVPEYSMTAAVFMRGLLQHEYGVNPTDVEWVQGRADRLGRKLPADVKLIQARRSFGARRDRFHDDCQQSARVPARLQESRPPVPELWGSREGLLPPHQNLSDHAHGGNPARDL
jgi:4,5-dihydroxyphthalate decarboxylase